MRIPQLILAILISSLSLAQSDSNKDVELAISILSEDSSIINPYKEKAAAAFRLITACENGNCPQNWEKTFSKFEAATNGGYGMDILPRGFVKQARREHNGKSEKDTISRLKFYVQAVIDSR